MQHSGFQEFAYFLGYNLTECCESLCYVTMILNMKMLIFAYFNGLGWVRLYKMFFLAFLFL